MKIGIDIDGVLTNYNQYVIEKGKEYCKKNKINKLIHPDTLSTIEMFGWSYYHEIKFWITHIFDYAKNNPVMENAANTIKKFKKEGYEIYIITSRYLAASKREKQTIPVMFLKKKMRSSVKKWLKDNNIIYDHIVFLKDKRKYIANNHIDIMIEDNPNNIKNFSTITKVICYHWGYNANIEGKNIIRCYNWKQIFEEIRKLSKERS